MTPDTRIRPMTEADIAQVARAHMRSFEGFFLSSLGPRFLEAFYAGLLTDEGGITLVAADPEGTIGGIAAGSSRPNGLIRRITGLERARFVKATLHAAVTQPKRLWELLDRVRNSGDDEVAEGVAWLHALAVLPERKGAGLGKALLTAFCEEASSLGCRAVELETDKDGNDDVRAFYESQGFEVTGSRVAPGEREMLEYARVLEV